MVNGLESEKDNLVVDSVRDWEPKKLMKHRSGVLSRGGLGNYMGGRGFNRLKSMESFSWEARQKGIAVMQSRGNKAVHKNGNRMRTEQGKDTVDITKVEAF